MNQSPLLGDSRYWRRPEDRQRSVNALFDRAAQHYDRSCGLMSPFGSGQTYRRQTLVRAGVKPGCHVLDVGTGTGLLAREIAHIVEPSGRVVGLDPSAKMMTAGRTHLSIGLVQGFGECLPFADGRFDFVTMGYALRHVPDLDVTFAEYRRVLKPRGRVLLLEITRPTSSVGLGVARIYFGTLVPLLARIGTGSADASTLMKFYWETIAQCVPPDVVIASLRRSGFDDVTRRVDVGIFSAYTGRVA